MSTAFAATPKGLSDWERRAFSRLPLNIPVFVDSERHSEVCWSLDVSLGGLALVRTANMQLGELLEVWFELPDGLDVECDAELVHRGGEQLGLRFIGMQHQSYSNLRTYVCEDESGIFSIPAPKLVHS